MVRMKTGHVWLALTALALVAARPAAAGPGPVPGNDPLITVDESGNGIGTLSPGFPSPDPLNPAAGPVLTYLLPFVPTPGDVLLTDADLGGPGDVIRFEGPFLYFYSDNVDGVDALADTPGPPSDTQDNTISIPEVGTEVVNGAVYTPMGPSDGFPIGQPGWDSSNPTYNIISDTPEPGSLALLATGGLPLLGMLRRRRAA